MRWEIAAHQNDGGLLRSAIRVEGAFALMVGQLGGSGPAPSRASSGRVRRRLTAAKLMFGVVPGGGGVAVEHMRLPDG